MRSWGDDPYRRAMVAWAKELTEADAVLGPLLAHEVHRRVKAVDKEVVTADVSPDSSSGRVCPGCRAPLRRVWGEWSCDTGDCPGDIAEAARILLDLLRANWSSLSSSTCGDALADEMSLLDRALGYPPARNYRQMR